MGNQRAIGGVLTSSLLVSFGTADYLRRLVAAGVDRAQTDAAITALDTILNPATADIDLDPAIRDRLLATSLRFSPLMIGCC